MLVFLYSLYKLINPIAHKLLYYQTGKKRKASPLTEPKEETPTAPKPKPKPMVTKTEPAEKARIKKGAIVSDDDTDDEPVVKSKGRYRHHKLVDEDYDHDVEPSLKAMMNIDDCEPLLPGPLYYNIRRALTDISLTTKLIL